MGIGFSMLKFIGRSEGRNACQKLAYIFRTKVKFHGNRVQPPAIYDYSHRKDLAHSIVLLPNHVDPKFKNPEVLWNAAEKNEMRKNSQVAMEEIIALPDDKGVTLDHRIRLATSYAKKKYVDKGLGVCVGIHYPNITTATAQGSEFGLKPGQSGTIVKMSNDTFILKLQEGEETKTQVLDSEQIKMFDLEGHNWHAHLLVPTRYFTEDGKALGNKARDLMPVVRMIKRKAQVTNAQDNGRIWGQYQDQFFREEGIAITVDPIGIVPQEHLGSRIYGKRAFELMAEHDKRLELNAQAAKDPAQVLAAITKYQSNFTVAEVDRFLAKHTPTEKVEEVRTAFWKQEAIVQLLDKKTHARLNRFTTKDIFAEEAHILRLADRINQRKTPFILAPSDYLREKYSASLNQEQKEAYTHILNGRGIACIQGLAGTGKSFLLKALHDAYSEHGGIFVRPLGVDQSTVNVLKEKGLSEPENIKKFLFTRYFKDTYISSGQEVWLIDEAAKIGNQDLLELLKVADKHKVRLIFAGDPNQFSSVGQGRLAQDFFHRYDSFLLQDVQRQTQASHREFVKDLADRKTNQALDALEKEGEICWKRTQREAMLALIRDWGKNPDPTFSLMMAQTNAEVAALNELARAVRKKQRQIDVQDYSCQMHLGRGYISEGDLIEFRGKLSGFFPVNNGMRGHLAKASEKEFVVTLEQGQNISFDPRSFHNYQLGYATTLNRSQGQTKRQTFTLYSPGIDNAALYVGMSRHQEQCGLYIAREEAVSLAEVKLQLARSQIVPSNTPFTYEEALLAHQENENKWQAVKALKKDSRLRSQIKGIGLEIAYQLKSKIKERKQVRQDQKPSDAYYYPNLPASQSAAPVEITQKQLEKEKQNQLIHRPIKNSASLPFALKKLTFFDLTEKYNARREKVSALELKIGQIAVTSKNGKELKTVLSQAREEQLLRNAVAYLIEEEVKVDTWKFGSYYSRKGEQQLKRYANTFAEVFSSRLAFTGKDPIIKDLISLYHQSLDALLPWKDRMIAAALGEEKERKSIDRNVFEQKVFKKRQVAFALVHRLKNSSASWEGMVTGHNALILKAERTAFTESLAQKEILAAPSAIRSQDTQQIIKRYVDHLATISEGQHAVAVEMSDTGKEPTAKRDNQEDYSVAFSTLLQDYS